MKTIFQKLAAKIEDKFKSKKQPEEKENASLKTARSSSSLSVSLSRSASDAASDAALAAALADDLTKTYHTHAAFLSKVFDRLNALNQPVGDMKESVLATLRSFKTFSDNKAEETLRKNPALITAIEQFGEDLTKLQETRTYLEGARPNLETSTIPVKFDFLKDTYLEKIKNVLNNCRDDRPLINKAVILSQDAKSPTFGLGR